MATFDWAGQGYSQGVRCLVDQEGMLEDYEQFVHLVLEGTTNDLPWWCMGQSMAGAVVLLFGQKAWARKQRRQSQTAASAAQFYSNFQGCIALAPLVTTEHLSLPTLAFVRAMAYFFPLELIPTFLMQPLPDEETWKSADVLSWTKYCDVRLRNLLV